MTKQEKTGKRWDGVGRAAGEEGGGECRGGR